MSSIGIYNEKSLHRFLKNYYCPNPLDQERLIGKWIVDGFCDGIIYEVQTAGFDKLREKLALLLPNYSLTIIYPLAHYKYLNWLNEEGAWSKPRKSPLKCQPLRICAELYKIKDHLKHHNLKIKLVLVDLMEYRVRGSDGSRKNKVFRLDQIPLKIEKEINLSCREDYFPLLAKLHRPFTMRDFKQFLRLGQRNSAGALQVLKYLDVIVQIGKSGRSFLYDIND